MLQWVRDSLNTMNLRDNVFLDTVYRDPKSIRDEREKEEVKQHDEEICAISSGLEELVLEDDCDFIDLE